MYSMCTNAAPVHAYEQHVRHFFCMHALIREPNSIGGGALAMCAACVYVTAQFTIGRVRASPE